MGFFSLLATWVLIGIWHGFGTSSVVWGIYFAGFTLATLIGYIPELSGSALLLVAFVGIAIALNDFQTRVAMKQNAGSANGGDEDGI